MAEIRGFVAASGNYPCEIPEVYVQDGFVYVRSLPRPRGPQAAFELKLGGPEALILADTLARASMELPVVVDRPYVPADWLPSRDG